MHYDISGKEI